MRGKSKSLGVSLLISMIIVLMMSSFAFAVAPDMGSVGSTDIIPEGTVLMTTPEGESILIEAGSFGIESSNEAGIMPIYDGLHEYAYVVSNLIYAMTEPGADGKSQLVTFPNNYKVPGDKPQFFVSDITKNQVNGLAGYYQSIGKSQIGWYIKSELGITAKKPLYVTYRIAGEMVSKRAETPVEGIYTFTWQRAYGEKSCNTSGNFWYDDGVNGEYGTMFNLGFNIAY